MLHIQGLRVRWIRTTSFYVVFGSGCSPWYTACCRPDPTPLAPTLAPRSVSISAASLIIIFMSVPLAYVLTPAAKTTIASFLSIFLVVGIGSDVVGPPAGIACSESVEAS